MLAQGTVCNRATFFGNGLQVVNCKGVVVVGRFPNDDSLALVCSARTSASHNAQSCALQSPYWLVIDIMS